MTYSIEDFLNVRSAAAANFSPDGSKVLVQANLTGTMQLFTVPSSGGDLTQITDFDEPVTGFYLPSTNDIVMLMDEGGNERHQIYLIGDDGQHLRKVVYEPDYLHQLGGMTRDGKTLAYASNRRNGVDFDVYVRDLASGDERCIVQIGGWCFGFGFSPDGRYLGVGRLTERSGDNQAFLVDLATDELVEYAEHDEESHVGGPSWLADGSGFYFDTDIDREFSCIARFDVASRTWEPVIEREATLSCTIDRLGRTLLVMEDRDGFRSADLFDAPTLRSRGVVPLPRRGIVQGPRFAEDGSRLTFTFTSPVDPGDAFVYNLSDGSLQQVTDCPKPVPQDLLVEPSVERITSFDGESVSLIVFRPERSAEPSPVVVSIHGGPESHYQPMFNPFTQYLVSQGYAVVAPNVRGSTGYGKRFHHLDDGALRLDSVRDLQAVHGWIAGSPELDEARAALAGGSYGGYMVLAGLAFQPDLWAAGIDIVGISSLVTFLENTAAWRRKFREREYGSLEHDRDLLIEASPITHVDRMRAPLFIIHGANDPRVPVGEARQIFSVLTDKGIPCELVVYDDEGHGLAKLKNRLDAYPRVVGFLDRVLT